MEDNYSDITKLFNEKIESYEMPVSEKVWESIDNKLDKKAANKYKAIIFRLRLMLASLIFLVGSFGLYFFLTMDSKPNEMAILKREAVVPVISDSKNNKILTPTNNSNDKLKVEKVKSNLNSSPNQVSASGSVIRKDNLVPTNGNMNSTNSKDEDVITETENSLIGANKKSITTGSEKVNTSPTIDETIVSSSTLTAPTVPAEASNNNFTEINTDIKGETVQSVIAASAKKDTASLSAIIPEARTKYDFVHRFSVIGYFSPDFTRKYLIDSNNNDNESQAEYNGKETPDFSFNTGLLIGYDLSSKWTIKTGAAYTYLMQSIKPKTIYTQTGMDGQQHYQFNTSYGNAQIPNDAGPAPQLGDSLKINATSTQLLQMISVPLIAKYQIRKNKFAYYAQFGLSMNFLIGEKLLVETQNGLETITNIEGLKEFNFGGIVGCGVSYNPVKKFSIIVEPTFRGFLSPINQNSSIKTYPYSIGISLGLAWHL